MSELLSNPAVTMAIGGVVGVIAAWGIAKIKAAVAASPNTVDDAVLAAVLEALKGDKPTPPAE